MKLSPSIILAAISISHSDAAAFLNPSSSLSLSSSSSSTSQCQQRSSIIVKGYLDNLSKDLYKEDDVPDEIQDSREFNKMDKSQLDRYGPGSLENFVDFEEFDGGDGQMGVAGDGKKGLDKFDTDATGSAVLKSMDKSRSRSAKNAWGTSTGYAEKLIQEKGMDTARAQQLENWANQQELLKRKNQQKFMTEQYDQVSEDVDWRSLAKFGVERNQEFDLNEAFGEAQVGDKIEDTFELVARNGAVGIKEFEVKNPYMGFADFRAAFTSDTASCFQVTPAEGSLSSKNPTQFIVKFKPEMFGVFEGYLVIETEDFKLTYKLIGTTG